MVKTYITVQGDMWDTIAFKVYGTTSCTDKLIDANTELRHSFTFPAGIEINTPEFETVEIADSMPPWKKVEG